MSTRIRSTLPALVLAILGGVSLAASAQGDAKRGEYLAKAGGCVGCHTEEKKDAVRFAGGRALKTPFGTFYGPNLTPHPEAGIGRWTEADFIRAMKGLGYSRISADDAVTLRTHGVTPEFARDVQSLGYKTISLDDLTSFRIHGVTTDFIRDANRSAKPPLSVDELLDLRIHRRK